MADSSEFSLYLPCPEPSIKKVKIERGEIPDLGNGRGKARGGIRYAAGPILSESHQHLPGAHGHLWSHPLLAQNLRRWFDLALFFFFFFLSFSFSFSFLFLLLFLFFSCCFSLSHFSSLCLLLRLQRVPCLWLPSGWKVGGLVQPPGGSVSLHD